VAVALYGSNPRAQAIALAGMLQSLQLVQDLAHDGGPADAASFRTCLASVLALDAESAEAVYGGLAGVRPGLAVLLAHLERPLDSRRLAPRRLEQSRYAGSIMKLERRLHARPEVGDALARELAAFATRCDPDLLDALPQVQVLADLYSEHVSPLGPKVMVAGQPGHLRQEAVAARIRALLLAALRAAVLWRQSGGTRLRLLLFRPRLVHIARGLELLAAESP
jgi:high frequency lysogenization protein